MSRLIKIAFCFFDYKGYLGGPKVNALRLLPELAKKNYIVHALILCRDDSHDSAAYLKRFNIIIHQLDNCRYTERSVKWVLDVCVDIQPDIFIPNHLAVCCIAAIELKKLGIPTIGAYRSEDLFYEGYGEEFIYGSHVSALSACIVVSEKMKRLLSRTNKNKVELRVIPSGVPVAASIKVDYCSQPLKVLYLGRLIQRQKRIFDMLRLFSECLDTISDVEFTMLGNTESERDRHEVLDFIRGLNQPSKLNWMGQVEPDFLVDYLQNFHVIVLMSDYEGVPGCLMDGMASGLVPIATRNAGTETLIDHGTNGFILDEVSDFVPYIKFLRDNRGLLASMSAQAHSSIIENFSIEVMVQLWDSLLKEVYLPHQGFIRPKYWDHLRLPERNAKLSIEDIRLTS